METKYKAQNLNPLTPSPVPLTPPNIITHFNVRMEKDFHLTHFLKILFGREQGMGQREEKGRKGDEEGGWQGGRVERERERD